MKKIYIYVNIALFGIAIFSPGVIYAGPTTNTVIDQEHFRFYDDDGTTVNNATGYGAGDAAVDIDITDVPASEQFHLRLGALQTVNKPNTNLTRTVKLQYSTNVTASDCSTGSWTDVPTQTVYTSEAFAQFTTGNFVDGDSTTGQLDATHSHIGGDGVETDGSPDPISFTSGGSLNTEHGEWEWALEEKAGTGSQQYWFRFINSDDTTTNVTWLTCPSLTTATVAASTFTQNNFAWYVNPGTPSENVTDLWGNPDITENNIITPVPPSNDPPDTTQELRLRMNITVNAVVIGANERWFKLQFRTGTDSDCSTGSWTDVGAAAGGEAFIYTSQTDVADDTTLTVSKLTGTDRLETYSRIKPANTPTGTSATGEDIEFDFHFLGTNSVSAERYLFRVYEANSDGTDLAVLDGYTNCPILHTEPGIESQMRHGNIFSGNLEQGFFWAD